MAAKFFLSILILVTSLNLWAARIGTISDAETDIYSSADFDSDVIDSVRRGEEFFVSNKTYDGFYKIKTKSGKIGFIPDTEVVIGGKPFQEKSYEDPTGELLKKSKALKKQKEEEAEQANAEDDDEVFNGHMRGVSLQLVNFHEDTMGGAQVDDLFAIGYKSLSETSLEIFAAFKAPRYYSEKLKASVSGFALWGSYGINNTVPVSSHAALRYGGGLLGRISQFKVAAPARNYDLQELTLGLALEGAWLVHFKKANIDFSVKYIFERSQYGVFGVSLLF